MRPLDFDLNKFLSMAEMLYIMSIKMIDKHGWEYETSNGITYLVNQPVLTYGPGVTGKFRRVILI